MFVGSCPADEGSVDLKISWPHKQPWFGQIPISPEFGSLIAGSGVATWISLLSSGSSRVQWQMEDGRKWQFSRPTTLVESSQDSTTDITPSVMLYPRQHSPRHLCCSRHGSTLPNRLHIPRFTVSAHQRIWLVTQFSLHAHSGIHVTLVLSY